MQKIVNSSSDKRKKKVTKRNLLIAALLISAGAGLYHLWYKPRQNGNIVNHKVGIIPRKILFFKNLKYNPLISSDGKYISYLADSQEVNNIFLMNAENLNSVKQITDLGHKIHDYHWLLDNQSIVYNYPIEKEGKQEYHLYKLNISDSITQDLTPFQGTDFKLLHQSAKAPHNLLLGGNARSDKWYDLYELELPSNKLNLILENDAYESFLIDNDGKVRFAVDKKIKPQINLLSNDGTNNFEIIKYSSSSENSFKVIGFNEVNNSLYFIDSKNRDTQALYSLDLRNNIKTTLGEENKVDIEGVILHPLTNIIQGYYYNYLKRNYKFIDEDIKAEFAYLKNILGAEDISEIEIINRSLKDDRWIIAHENDITPRKYYFYDRKAADNQGLKPLFSDYEELSKYELLKMQPLVIKNRDKVDLVSYLTIPKASAPHPLIVWVHDGPHDRDSWKLSVIHQWLANRGYAVLSVNYRGSSGFGKNFAASAQENLENKIINDLVDATQYLLTNYKEIDNKKVAVAGSNYGGYAAVKSAISLSDLFSCAVYVDLFSEKTGVEDTRKELMSKSIMELDSKKVEKPVLILAKEDVLDDQKSMISSLPNLVYVESNLTNSLNTLNGLSVSDSAIIEAFFNKYLGGKLEKVSSEYEEVNFTFTTGTESLPEAKINVIK